MKKLLVAGVAAFTLASQAEWHADKSVMSEEYWKIWTPEVTAKLNVDIEKYRKADYAEAIGAPAGAEVKVEQIGHAFFFGAHIFNYNQLGKKEWNDRYKELYGTLFNSATVAFYWKTLEPYQGQVRFQETYRDTEEFWNNCPNPMQQPHWRRPAIDPVINFLRSRDLRIHGHPLCWGNIEWQLPTWIWDEFCPTEEKYALEAASGIKLPAQNWKKPLGVKDWDRETYHGKPDNGTYSWNRGWQEIFKKLSEEEVAKICPTYFKNLNKFTFDRVRQIAERYGTRVQSWDVCNESADDFNGKSSVTGKLFVRAPRYGVIASDLCYNAFKISAEVFPKSAWLNINDYAMGDRYFNQIKDLEKNGCRIDVVGSQMHLFDPAESAKIRQGKVPEFLKPEGVAKRFARLSEIGKPIHLSEITITAPDTSSSGQMVQAIIMRDLYRAWFAVEKMNGITWWNVVDNCGAPGEPSMSGLFTRDMRPKTAYFAMDDLINNEWKTRTTVKADDAGKVSFRGFRGRYRLTWKDAKGSEIVKLIQLK